MSFDVYLQGFFDGESRSGDGDAARSLLDPFISSKDEHRLTTSDGGAEVFGLENASTGLMFSHLVGESVWVLIVDVARAGGFAILPVGCAVAVLDQTDIRHLPPELVEDMAAELVASGSELRRLVIGY